MATPSHFAFSIGYLGNQSSEPYCPTPAAAKLHGNVGTSFTLQFEL